VNPKDTRVVVHVGVRQSPTQWAAPAVAEYAPTAQEVQLSEVADAATPPYVPATHAVQPDVPVATELYAPAGQAVQPLVPVVNLLYAPSTQLAQAEVPVGRLLNLP